MTTPLLMGKEREIHAAETDLKNALKDIDKLLITERTYDKKGDQLVSFETIDKSEIREFIEGISLDSKQRFGILMCRGDVEIKFYNKDEVSVHLNYASSNYLQWRDSDIWKGDTVLNEQGEFFLTKWLSERDINAPLVKYKRNLKDRAKHRIYLDRAFRGLPELLKEEFIDRKQFYKNITTEFSKKEKQIDTLFFIFGARLDGWNGLGNLDMSVSDVLERYSKSELQDGVRRAFGSDDAQRKRGAARYWVMYGSKLKDWKPENDHNLIITLNEIKAEEKKRAQSQN